MADLLHPAVRIVEAAERLWTENDARAACRAQLIVSRLIETGFLWGKVRDGMPLAPTPGDFRHLHTSNPAPAPMNSESDWSGEE